MRASRRNSPVRSRAPTLVSGRTAEFRGEPPEIFNHTRLQIRATAEASIQVGVFTQPSTFWRTEIFRALGGADPALRYVMDWGPVGAVSRAPWAGPRAR
ncbi:MAG: hypothetical protein WDO13_00015 [Verrucomicrobiota bacterium]